MPQTHPHIHPFGLAPEERILAGAAILALVFAIACAIGGIFLG